MKVLIQLRQDAYQKYGGDILHAEKTAAALKSLGISVDLSCQLCPPLGEYDLVHLFNMDWARDPYLQACHAKKNGKPIVLSPLHHCFAEIDEFERTERYDFRRLVNPIFRRYVAREYLKNLYRAIFSFDFGIWKATIKQWWVGLRRQYVELLKMSALVLPNTRLEEEELRKEFGVNTRTMIVPAGVDTTFSEASPDWFLREFADIAARLGDKFVLMVGRIEPRKNQLRVIKALEGTGISLLLVGRYNYHHPEYVWRVKNAIKQNDKIEHIESIPHENMGSVFSAATCHVLASFFETTGLVNLEAGLAGCNVVTTSRGFGKEYLGDFAEYIEPNDVDSIREGIRNGLSRSFSEDFRWHISSRYTWDRVGELTLSAYKEVLAR